MLKDEGDELDGKEKGKEGLKCLSRKDTREGTVLRRDSQVIIHTPAEKITQKTIK